MDKILYRLEMMFVSVTFGLLTVAVMIAVAEIRLYIRKRIERRKNGSKNT